MAIEITESHHEKHDGSGYPAGLSGEAIPLSARIVAVAEVFDALTQNRSYRQAKHFDAATAHIQKEAGGSFDPEVVDAFIRAQPKIAKFYANHSPS